MGDRMHETPPCRPDEDCVRVREYRASDLDAVKRLIHATIDACYPAVYPAEAVAFFKEYHSDEAIAKRAEQGHTLVLEQCGQIIGTGTLVDDHVTAVFVDRSLQKQGLGKRIMTLLEAEARSAGVRSMTLDASLPSKRFYDSLGYVVVEEAFHPVANDKTLDYYRMRKDLCTEGGVDVHDVHGHE